MSTTSSLCVSSSTALWSARRLYAGPSIRMLQASIHPTLSVCATGYLSQSQMVMSRCTPPCRQVAESGSRCRYAPSVWTRWQSEVSPHTGAIKVSSRVVWVPRSGCRGFVRCWRIPPRSLSLIASRSVLRPTRFLSLPLRVIYASSLRVLRCWTSPSISTPRWVLYAWVARLVAVLCPSRSHYTMAISARC